MDFIAEKIWAGAVGLFKLITFDGSQTLAVVGQQESGKSTFRKCLEKGVYQSPAYHVTTVKPESAPWPEVGSLNFRLKALTEVPGQWTSWSTAQHLIKNDFNIIYIFLDATTDIQKSKDWLEQLCVDLVSQTVRLREEPFNRLQMIMLVCNKWDTVESAHQPSVRKALEQMRKVVLTRLELITGSMLRNNGFVNVCEISCVGEKTPLPGQPLQLDGMIANLIFETNKCIKPLKPTIREVLRQRTK